MRETGKNPGKGFTVIELLIVIAIIGILSALVLVVVGQARKKSDDVRVRNDVRQLRWLAEIVYSTRTGSFLNWTDHPDIQGSLDTLKDDLGEVGIAESDIALRDSETGRYCVSAPLKSSPGRYYCADASAEFTIADSACPDTAPLVCP